MSGSNGKTSPSVCVLGAGSWGTALALHCVRKGLDTRLWCRDASMAAQMKRTRVNPRYLQEYPLPPELSIHDQLDSALDQAQLVLFVVPSSAIATLGAKVRGCQSAPSSACMVAASKGICRQSLQTPGEQLLGLWPREQVAVLGGPSFAAEVAKGLPTGVVIAGAQLKVRTQIQSWLSGAGMRVYTSTDRLGVELAGALKNVIALAAGICDGAKLGANARAALITRGLAEMQRLALAAGASPSTLWGLSGVGDLVLTCTGGLSRNRRVGLALGEGKVLDQVLRELGMVAEGVYTTQSARALARKLGVEMPIVETVHDMLYDQLPVQDALARLMDRALRDEG